MKIKLPDLADYRSSFTLKGGKFPLSTIRSGVGGLLSELPQVRGKEGWPWTEEFRVDDYRDKGELPKITIVTPSYNQQPFIEQTIRSVLLQNYPNLEYIIIDGGSDDGTVEIIKKYSRWLSYWESEKDRGQGHAINKGFSIASGSVYAWINSDDYYLNGTFLKVINEFEASSAEFIYGESLNFVVDRKEFEQPSKQLPLLDYFIRIPSLAQPSCFWRSVIHQPIWEELNCSLDYELWLRLVKGRSRSLIKEPLSVANSHAEAKTHDPNMKQKWENDHFLICSSDAHGPVNDWNRRVFIYRLRKKLYKFLRLI